MYPQLLRICNPTSQSRHHVINPTLSQSAQATCLKTERAGISPENARVAALVAARVDQPPLPRPTNVIVLVC